MLAECIEKPRFLTTDDYLISHFTGFSEMFLTSSPWSFISHNSPSPPKEAMFSKPSPLMKLMQCCERLLSEQKPAPFRSVLPDGYMEEVIGSTVMIPSPNRSKHSATAVPSSTHVIGQVFSALDDLLCGHSVLGSSSRHDNRVCYPPDPTIQLWSGMTNGPMIPKLPLWPMIPITQLTNLSGIEAPVEQVTVPTPCEDNASSLTLMSSQPISEPCSIAHVHDLRLHERIIKSTSNTSSVIDKELLSSQSIVSPTATSFGNGLPPVVSENQKQKDNSQSSFQVENYADSNCTTFHGVHLQNQGNTTAPYSSLTMLANLMLLTTLLQQVAVAPAGLNPTSSPTVCSDISKTRINSMESRGSIGEPIAVIEATNPNVANPLLWPRPQSPVVLSTLLSLLAAPPVRITKP